MPSVNLADVPFTGSFTLADGVAVAAFAGEIDIATLPQFQAVMDEAVISGAPSLIVDMADVTFCGAQGLTVLTTTTELLKSSGRRLTVSPLPAAVYRLLQITGLLRTLRVDQREETQSLVQGLAAGLGLALTRDVLDAALRLVVTMAQAVVVGADGVSITLPRHGRLGTVAASNDVVLEMDHDQYDTGEGPCLDAATQGRSFHIDSLREESRWPAFVPRARARGIESILSTPLVAGPMPIGALNVYSRTVGAFAAHEKEWADQFAVEAATVVTRAQSGPSVASLNAQIHQALRSREVIALAQGVVMHRDGVSAVEAYGVLRDLSRRTGEPLRDICRGIVGDDADAATPVEAGEVGSDA